jgi:pimeloyl-ACP methyl ester carboxylesterase
MFKTFKNLEGKDIAASVFGEESNPLVVFLHGGGQTRFAWDEAAESISQKGFFVITYDLRGHGDSFWSEEGNYRIHHHKEDLISIIENFDQPANLVGASLGGMTSLSLAGDPNHSKLCKTLIMVDIGIYPNQEGSDKIVEFMRSAADGFASLEEAANYISNFLPHREKPKDLTGLNKNLRKKEDRFYWHWDPKFLQGRQDQDIKEYFGHLEDAAKSLDKPTLLIRGGLSDVLTEEDKNYFLNIVSHAEFEEINNAAHMVAGDKNDIFSEAVEKFLVKNN